MRRPSEAAAQRLAALIEATKRREAMPTGGQTIDEFIASTSKPRRRASSARAMELAMEQTQALFDGRDFARFRGVNFVGLYAIFHRETYGIAPLELAEGDAWFGASSAAQKMLETDFKGAPLVMVEFMRWVWARERKSVKRKRAEGEAVTFRIGWRFQFATRKLLTDFRVAHSRV